MIEALLRRLRANDAAAGASDPPAPPPPADPHARRHATYDDLVELREGYVWPKDDFECWRSLWIERGNVAAYAALARGRSVVVQAGGNCGMVPYLFADHFEAVYTFEPDPLNFYCLARNTQRPNIVKFQAALGDARAFVDTKETWERNVGAHIVVPGGVVPTMRIDDLGLAACDLIQLDIEGSEYDALAGARETIGRHRPVIVLEMKGNAAHFGRSDADAEALVVAMGYRRDRDISNDVVFMPEAAR